MWIIQRLLSAYVPPDRHGQACYYNCILIWKPRTHEKRHGHASKGNVCNTQKKNILMYHT